MPSTELVLLRAAVQELEPEADASTGAPAAACSRITSSRPSSRRRAMAGGKAPTPGTTSPSAARRSPCALVNAARAPTCSNAFSTLRRLPIP